MTPANYESWRNKKLWTIYELAFLLKGWEPKKRRTEGQWYQKDPEMDEAENFYQYLCSIAARDPEMMDLNPHSSKIDNVKLLRWVGTLEGIEIPSELTPILDKYESPKKIETLSGEKKHAKVARSLGEKEKEHLLITIGALAQIIFKKTGNLSGEDKLNISGVADYCIEILPQIPGMKKSTLRNRISKGVKLLKKTNC